MVNKLSGRERIARILARKEVDRIGLFEHFWGDTYKAWLSDGTTNAIDRIGDVGGWYTTGSYPNVIFASKAQIPSGPQSGFRDEYGGTDPGAPVWTGTKPDGTRATSIFQGTTGNCIGWSTGTLGSDSGVTGSNGFLTGSWTERSAQQCHNQGALYCFQQ